MRQRTRKRGGEGGGEREKERGRGGGVPGKQKSLEITMKVCIVDILELSYDYCIIPTKYVFTGNVKYICKYIVKL